MMTTIFVLIAVVVIYYSGYKVGRAYGIMAAHQSWERMLRQRGHRWVPSPPPAPPDLSILPTACRYSAGGASCVHWCGNEECMK